MESREDLSEILTIDISGQDIELTGYASSTLKGSVACVSI